MNKYIPQEPNQIYDFIDSTISEIILEIDKKDGNESVQNSKEQVKNIILSFKQQVFDSAVSELKKNSEWNKLIIAFYGETNAGKSTLIESLRIYLGESTKSKDIFKFNSLRQKFNNIPIEKIIQIKEYKDKLDNQELAILLQNEQNGKTLINTLANHLKLFTINFKRKFLNTKICEMINLADGSIIGDGRPDFTRKATSYEFDDFILVDLPGIEGSEEKVIDEILTSVKRAHTIFYVTSSVTPPQKGDDNKKGTLEKIKEHLNDQSEVYVLFNKRINSHQQLKENLLSEGEQKSLLVVDEKMREIIGDSYASHKVVSAKIAFLSVAECLLEGSKAAQDRAKFLDKFNKNELIKRSNLDEFGLFLKKELTENAQKR